MSDLNFILKYKDIKKISEFCEEENINYSNLVNGRTTEENEQKIANLCKKEVINLYSEIIKDGVING